MHPETIYSLSLEPSDWDYFLRVRRFWTFAGSYNELLPEELVSCPNVKQSECK